MAQILARVSCRIMYPLLIGTMGVNIVSKITRKRRELVTGVLKIRLESFVFL